MAAKLLVRLRLSAALAAALLVLVLQVVQGTQAQDDALVKLEEQKRVLDARDVGSGAGLEQAERYGLLEAYVRIGAALHQATVNGASHLRHRDLAIDSLERGLALVKDGEHRAAMLDLRLLLADLYRKTSRVDRALEVVDAELALDSFECADEDVEERTRRAKLLHSRSASLMAVSSRGRRDEGIRDMVRALELLPSARENPQLQLQLGYTGVDDVERATGDAAVYGRLAAKLEAELTHDADALDAAATETGAISHYAIFNMLDQALAHKSDHDHDRDVEESDRDREEETAARDAVAARAYSYLARGAAIMRRERPPEVEAMEQMEGLMRSIFTRGLLELCRANGIGEGVDEAAGRVILVVGLPRSGSTLVEQILQTHPEVTGLGEESELTFFVKNLHAALVSALGPGGALDFAKVRAFVAAEAPKVLALMAGRHENAASGNVVFVDKMLSHYVNLGLIHLALPSARVVHIFKRSTRDAHFSLFKRQFQGGTAPWSYDWGDMQRAHASYAATMAHWRANLPPGVLLDVAYEDLVADLEATARTMLAHCGLNWDPAVLRFHEASDRVVLTHSAHQVNRPIFASHAWAPYRAHLPDHFRV